MTAPSDQPFSAVHAQNAPPDRVALAGFDAGLLNEADSALTEAHVTGCDGCQAVLAGLRAARADIGRLGGTSMPVAVADRIAAALAAEPGPGRPLTAGGEGTGSSGMTQPGSVPEHPAETDPAATDDLVGDSAGPDSGRHRAAEVIELRSARRLRRIRVASGLAAGLVLLGGGGYLLADLTGGGEDAATSSADGVAQPESGVDSGAGSSVPRFDRESLAAAVGQLLEDSPRATSAPGSLPGSVPTEEAVDDTAVERDCLISIPVATAQALSITRAIYEGQPAIVVLLAAEPGQVQVTVVSDCADGAPPAVIDEFTADR